MKRLIVAILSIAIMLTLCACGSGVGEVSHDSDPLSYFESDHTWRMNEIEDECGALEVPNEQTYGRFGYREYYGSNISAFGESWDLQIYEVEGSVPYVVSGCFFFDQQDYSDREFVKYRDKIVAFYTKLYGNPDPGYGTEEMPAWCWNTPTMTIALQDSRAYYGQMHLLFWEAD